MRKYLLPFLLLSTAYSEWTGNHFLELYPFDKKTDEMDHYETAYMGTFTAFITGIESGNTLTLELLSKIGIDRSSTQFFNLQNRICDMPTEQIVRIIKKWCDDNPTQTHLPFYGLVFTALLELPIRDCE
tara:strand:- start:139 stop:525 length:387 start_codon:yes stop_codon:yes gene_type:complete